MPSPSRSLDDQEKLVLQDEGTVKNDQGTVQYDQLQLGLLPHHRADRRPGGSAAGGSRQCRAGERQHADPRRHHAVAAHYRRLHHCRRTASAPVLARLRKQAPSSPSMPLIAPAQKKIATGELAGARQPDRHHHRHGQGARRFRQQGRRAVPQPVCQYPPAGETLQGVTLVPASADPAERPDLVRVCDPGRRRAHAQRQAGRDRRGQSRRSTASIPGDVVANSSFDKLQDNAKVTSAQPSRRGRHHAAGGGRRSGASSRAQRGHRRQRRQSIMSPSRPFILRPVATSLLMAAIFLVGIVGYHAAAGFRAAAGRLSDHPGGHVLSGRQPGRDGDDGHRAAGAAVRPDARA